MRRSSGWRGRTSRVLLVALVATLAAGCRRYQPCGWDENLEPNGLYGLGFIEEYGPESTTARYDPSLGFIVTGVDAIPPCPNIDETGVGRTFVLRLPEETGICSVWGPSVVEPVLATEYRAATSVANWHGYNMLIVDGFRDLGGGCRGVWELTVHAPGNDPFVPQNPLDRPGVLAYRYFSSDEDACFDVLGLDRATYEFPRCGDVYVAAMDRR
jgi:hypothetical protein